MARSNCRRKRQPTCRPKARRRLLGLLAALLCLVACEATLRQSGPAISVFSGRTAQQRILAEVTLQTLQHHGYAVEDKSGWGSEWQVRQAMAAGNADLCWAYTNDTWTLHLRHDEPIWNSSELYTKVRDEDALNGITWLPPSPCVDGLALITTRDLAEAHGLWSIEDLIDILVRVDPALRLGVSEELAKAAGGLVGLERRYGYSFQERYIVTVTPEAAYDALLADECEVILSYRGPAALYPEVQVLVDSRDAFPTSELALGVRSGLLSTHPYLEGHLLELTRALTSRELARMEREVTLEGDDIEDVARAFLKANELLD